MFFNFLFRTFVSQTIKTYDIMIVVVDWCTDGIPEEELGLPSVVRIPYEIEEDKITDYLSNRYGYLVESWVKWKDC